MANSPEPLRIQPIASSAIPAVAAMLARSFEVDAGYRFLFPDARTREVGLADFFARNLAIHLPHGCTKVAVSDGVVATVTVRPPGGVPISTWTMLRHGVLPMVLTNGTAYLRRLLWLKNTYEAIEHELGAGRPYWHVHMMAVHEKQQGMGLGSQVLAQALAPCAAQPVPIMLTTHREVNVVFYRRAGFDVVDERMMKPPGGEPYTVWLMKRPG